MHLRLPGHCLDDGEVDPYCAPQPPENPRYIPAERDLCFRIPQVRAPLAPCAGEGVLRVRLRAGWCVKLAMHATDDKNMGHQWRRRQPCNQVRVRGRIPAGASVGGRYCGRAVCYWVETQTFRPHIRFSAAHISAVKRYANQHRAVFHIFPPGRRPSTSNHPHTDMAWNVSSS